MAFVEVGATAAGATRVPSNEVYREEDEDYGETFVRPFGMAQRMNEIQAELENEPVLKRAASVFFADIRASATSSDGEAKSHHGKDVSQQPVQNSPEPFPMALPLWEFELSSKNPDIDKAVPDLLDLNVPLAPVMDCGFIGGDDNFREFALQDYACENHDPLSQYSQVPQAQKDPWKGDLYSWVGDLPHPPSAAKATFPQDVSLLETLTVPPPVSASVTQVQNHFENVFLYTRIPGEDDQDLEFGNFWDGEKPDMVPPARSVVSEHFKLQGACTPDCDTLVSSISNLSKVLLGHYRAKSSNNQTNIKSLQSAILDLSKCLVKAHVQTSPTETEQVDDKNTFFEEADENSVFNDTEAEEEPGKAKGPLEDALPDDSNEQLMARFRILLGLSGKQAYDSPTERSVVEDNLPEEITNPKPEQNSFSFLSSNQVEQRLALLKSRPNWSDDEEESHEGAATMNETHILVEDNYVAKRGCGSQEAKQETPSHARPATSAGCTVGNVGTSIMMTDSGLDKLSDIEESGWEHI